MAISRIALSARILRAASLRDAMLLMVGLIVGLAIAYFTALNGKPATVGNAGGNAAQNPVRWKMSSAFPSAIALYGTLGSNLSATLSEISGGDIALKFLEPGALVPGSQLFEAVSSGAVDAGWSMPGFWSGKVPALQLFTAVPFGPAFGEYMAWYYYGGGEALHDALYARHNIKGLLCGIVPPEAAGWFRQEITSIDDLKGLKMRINGLGAKVLEKFGVSIQSTARADIFMSLNFGSIDAAEFSMPVIDKALGFYQVAKHYYFPGWQQQSTYLELMMNLDLWTALSPVRQAQFRAACGENFRRGIAEGEATQFAAIEDMKDAGVTLHRFSEQTLGAFAAAWDAVVAEEAAADPDFAKIWNSMQIFRARYAVWQELGYL
jgi:TRAP-type mannitol/chloroaromatic compound transport system substrate-binding protein